MESLPEVSNLVKCACGCGTDIHRVDSRGIVRKFALGHSNWGPTPCVDLPGERWARVPGYEPYEASNLGRVRRSNSNNIRRCHIDRWGYWCVVLSLRNGVIASMKVHQLVLIAFVGPKPPGMLTRHLDGNPRNNRLENLAWGTAAENQADKARHGTLPKGIKSVTRSKLTPEKVRELRALSGSISPRELAQRYGINTNTVRKVVIRKTWRWVE